ncbi:MAG TPA: hypothetical protein DEA97_14225 [Bacteroidales bacterium]|nr:MAG: hypothetical protein UR43_C0011G0013 [candidate division TM6 bacterium GW2011_GWF2_33_332]OFY78605.1 MAG: hypothetical protein A2281_16520 [Bacteroidetes bacterium RIFOXYA12_FULL_38_20]HBS87716.1 hypothetical protein [Bacteroidales bacterium]
MIRNFIQVSFLLILLFNCTTAQTNYTGPNIVTDGLDGYSSIYIADLDGDGDKDLLTSSRNENKISWYRNIDGTGKFGPEIVVDNNISDVRTIFSDDIDNDGDFDIISGSCVSNEIVWYENTDAFFGNKTVIADDIEVPVQIFTADLTMDGFKDVIVTSLGDSKVCWFANLGDGSFGPVVNISDYTETPHPVYSSLSDVDNDGDLDILIASENNYSWYNNSDGLGLFGPQQIISDAIEQGTFIEGCDVDGDGDNDAIAFNNTDEKIVWYENSDGLGLFIEKQTINEGSTYYVRSLSVGDIDGDDDIDVITSDNGTIYLWENADGLGNFVLGTEIFNIQNIDIGNIFCGDFDNDIDFDIVFTSNENIFSVKNQDGIGTFAEYTYTGMNTDFPNVTKCADIDNDGDNDIITGTSGKITWFENVDGSGTFDNEHIIDFQGAKFLEIVDIDNDGDMDIAGISITEFYAYVLTWFENEGDIFIKHPVFDIGSPVNAFTAGDVDNDGDIDMVYSTDIKVSWHINTDGAGTFIIGGVKNNTSKAIGLIDIDCDTDLDLLSTTDESVVWYENMESGIFSDYAVIDDEATSVSVQIADFNSDNKNDFVIQTNEGILLYENLGGALFEERLITYLNYQTTFIPDDVDNDNDQDLIYCYKDDSECQLMWIENSDGLGNFGLNYEIDILPFSAIAIEKGDIDNDVDNEIIITQNDFDRVCWYRCNSVKILTQPQSKLVCPFSDVNFIFTTNISDSIKWQINQGDGFIDIIDDAHYSGVNTNVLYISDVEISMTGNEYRCQIYYLSDTLYSDTAVLWVDSTLIVPTVIDLPVLSGECGIEIIEFPTAVICSEEILIATTDDPLVYNEQGSFIINWNYNNGYGGSFEQNQNIIIDDNSSPVMDTIGDETIELDFGIWVYFIQGDEFDPKGVLDNCDNTEVVNDYNGLSTLAGEIFVAGTTLITWTVTDAAENQTQESFTLTIKNYDFIHSVEDIGLSVFPNPSDGIINFSSNNEISAKLELLSLSGVKFFEKNIELTKDQIDISNIPSGLYILKIVLDGNVYMTKITKL